MSRFVCLASLLVASAPARAACGDPVSPALLAAVVEQAEMQAGRNAGGFAVSTDQLALQLPCLSGLVSPRLAARIHRLQGLVAFVDGARDQTLLAFAASRRLEAEFTFPADVFPPAHPVSLLYQQSGSEEWSAVPVDRWGATRSWFDGVATELRPGSFPTVVQLEEQDGTVVASAYLWPGDELPQPPPLVLDARPVRISDNAPTLLVSSRPAGGRAHVPLAVSAGVAALAAGGIYAAALATAHDYRNNQHENRRLEVLRERANTLVYVSAGFGTVAVGTGLGAAFTWPR